MADAMARPTVLVDVRPAVLQGALVVLLEELGVDDVLDASTVDAVDAVVLSPGRPAPALGTKVVITLPAGDDDEGRGTVALDGRPETTAVRIARIEDILTLLDLCCPGAAPRRLR